MITLLIYIALVPATPFLSERGRGVGLSLRFIISPLTWPLLCFSVMSELNLDNPGFQSPGALPNSPPPHPLPGSSLDSAADRRKCESCHRWMSKKTFDHHTLCVSCSGSECDIGHSCEECADWPEEDVLLYVKHRHTLKSRRSKSKPPPPPPPAAPSVPSSQPGISVVESRLELLTSQVSALTELFTARLAAPHAFCVSPSASQAPSQARLKSDARCPHPIGTDGFQQESQALGGSGREPDATSSLHDRQAKLGGDLRASAGLSWGAPSMQAPRHSPLAPGGVFVQPSADAPGPRAAPPPSGAAPGGSSGPAPPFPSAPPGTPRDSEDSDSGSSSTSAALDSSATQMAELVYDFCPEARPFFDSTPPPRCSFEAWFDPSPASSSARPRYRVYPRVAAVDSEVADRAAVLHRRSKPLSAVLQRKIRRYAVADQQHFVAPQPVNPSFSRLAGASAVGSKRWGSVTFAEMERLERLFRSQLEVTSSSLWMLSGILAMLKRDRFKPSTPGLFNTAIASVSASLASQDHSAASRSVFLHAKRRGSLLAHSKVPIPEPQKRALVVSPGSDSGLIEESLLDSVAHQVKENSLVSSSLVVSKALSSHAGSKSVASSSPLAGPLGFRPPRSAQRSGKRSMSSSRFGDRKRFLKTFGFSQVGAVPLPNPVRQLSVHPLAGLEGQGRGSMGGGGPPGRVSHTFSSASSSVYGTHPLAFVCPYFHHGGSAR